MAISLSTSAPKKLFLKCFYLVTFLLKKENYYHFSIVVVDERKLFIKTW